MAKKAAIVLRCHKRAAQYPIGSDENRKWLEAAHRAFMDGGERGRPKGRVNMADHAAVIVMGWLSQTTGETCARKLARMAIDDGMVPAKGAVASRVDRLARKYKKHGSDWVFRPVEK